MSCEAIAQQYVANLETFRWVQYGAIGALTALIGGVTCLIRRTVVAPLPRSGGVRPSVHGIEVPSSMFLPASLRPPRELLRDDVVMCSGFFLALVLTAITLCVLGSQMPRCDTQCISV